MPEHPLKQKTVRIFDSQEQCDGPYTSNHGQEPDPFVRVCLRRLVQEYAVGSFIQASLVVRQWHYLFKPYGPSNAAGRDWGR
jgi:hypothetical protein